MPSLGHSSLNEAAGLFIFCERIEPTVFDGEYLYNLNNTEMGFNLIFLQIWDIPYTLAAKQKQLFPNILNKYLNNYCYRVIWTVFLM